MKVEITNTEVYGFKMALRGMRNPKNSWSLSDSKNIYLEPEWVEEDYFDYNVNANEEGYVIGEKDLNLAQTLIKGGSEHCKFLRQIQVWCDINEPRYWWSEFDTYKIGTTADSTSTMHKLFNNQSPITKEMFVYCYEDEDIVDIVVKRINDIREEWLTIKNNQQYKDYLLLRAKRLLFESFLQLRTVNMNYQVVRHIVSQRKHHRLKDEWQTVFCKWATTLPYSKELIFYGMEDEYERLK